MINQALGTLYRSGFWLKKQKAAYVGKCFFAFLGHYSICSNITLRNGKRRFAMTPKHHMMAHSAFDLLDLSSKVEWVPNPIAHTNQVQEDFIGKPSRLSRRVSTRSLHSSVLLRSLVIYQDSLNAARVDDRGRDAYGNHWLLVQCHSFLNCTWK